MTTLALSLPLVDAEVLHLTSSSLSRRPSPSTSAALLAAHPLMAVRRLRRMKPSSALGASLSGALHSASRSSYSTDGNRVPIHRRLRWNGRLKLNHFRLITREYISNRSINDGEHGGGDKRNERNERNGRRWRPEFFERHHEFRVHSFMASSAAALAPNFHDVFRARTPAHFRPTKRHCADGQPGRARHRRDSTPAHCVRFGTSPQATRAFIHGCRQQAPLPPHQLLGVHCKRRSRRSDRVDPKSTASDRLVHTRALRPSSSSTPAGRFAPRSPSTRDLATWTFENRPGGSHPAARAHSRHRATCSRVFVQAVREKW